VPAVRIAPEAHRGDRRIRKRFLIPAAAVLLTLIWGTTWAAIRIGLDGIPPFTGLAGRFALASALLLVAGAILGVRFGRTARERRLWVANALLSFCGSYGVVYWCEQWVPSGLGSVLFATYPLFVAMLAHFVIPGETLTIRSLAGIVTGFVGVSVIFSEDFALLGGHDVRIAAAIMLASPILSAVSTVAIKRWGEGVHPVSLSAVPMGMTAVVMGAVALATERNRPMTLDATSVGALVYLAVFGSAVTFCLYYWLMSEVTATRASLVAYTIPVVAVAVGAFFLHEPLTRRTIAGTALVVLGVALAVARRKV
jgi:drug/metabolite transporter (DMT)-like permease